MEIDIRPLEPGLLDDYLHFFDDVAFSDHPEWSWCYCTYFHMDKEAGKKLEAEYGDNFTRDVLRNIAIRLINERKMQGYLAYSGGEVVGWCNAADKKSYSLLCERQEIWDDSEDLAIKAITCFVVAPGARRQGVATALLNRVVQDAAAQCYDVLEAYPAQGELDCFQHYHGHPAMYERSGFTPHKELKGYWVYRRYLK